MCTRLHENWDEKECILCGRRLAWQMSFHSIQFGAVVTITEVAAANAAPSPPSLKRLQPILRSCRRFLCHEFRR
jgi:hypothetical protein